MSYLTSVKTINGETSGFYQYPIKYVATSAEATENSTLYVLTGESYGAVVPTLFFKTDPYNPLNLPANTVRIKFESGYTPSMGNSRTLVDAGENVWDIYKQSNNWADAFTYNSNILEVLGANTTEVTNMIGMLFGCNNLTNIALFDTSNVTNMNSMFDNCSSLNIIPLYNTSKATDMSYMFNDCTTIESGALALYQQASSQTTPPTYHEGTFRNCGLVTQTGSAELAQIPRDWGGRLLLE